MSIWTEEWECKSNWMHSTEHCNVSFSPAGPDWNGPSQKRSFEVITVPPPPCNLLFCHSFILSTYIFCQPAHIFFWGRRGSRPHFMNQNTPVHWPIILWKLFWEIRLCWVLFLISSSCMDYCNNTVWHGSNTPVMTLLRCYWSPGYFDSSL